MIETIFVRPLLAICAIKTRGLPADLVAVDFNHAISSNKTSKECNTRM